jgi:hypothetical protein
LRDTHSGAAALDAALHAGKDIEFDSTVKDDLLHGGKGNNVTPLVQLDGKIAGGV